jgi:hypothetical protein
MAGSTPNFNHRYIYLLGIFFFTRGEHRGPGHLFVIFHRGPGHLFVIFTGRLGITKKNCWPNCLFADRSDEKNSKFWLINIYLICLETYNTQYTEEIEINTSWILDKYTFGIEASFTKYPFMLQFIWPDNWLATIRNNRAAWQRGCLQTTRTSNW